MIGEVYNPLERYTGEFQEAFRRHAQEFFDELVRTSGVDADENARLVNEYKKWNQEAESAERRHSRFVWLAVCVVLLCLAALGVGIWCGFFYPTEIQWLDLNRLLALGICLLVLLLFVPLSFTWIFPQIKQAGKARDEARQQAEDFHSQAETQMVPLNELYTWDIPGQLIERTMPDVHFDKFSHQKCMERFAREFGWSGELGDDTSVIFAQSGELAGNPFVFCKLFSQLWKEEEYTGSITIHWTTRERDSNGRYYTKHHTEVLTATVTKPAPWYYVHSMLAYGNEGAPNLVFERECSGLAQDISSFLGKMRQRSLQKKLEDFSRNLEDDSNYTMMSNKEFETLFNTMNRNNEVEFRLMFTPLAQVQMLQLLKDTTAGYGDDFWFDKQQKMNFIRSQHLNACELDTNPEKFHHFDLKAAEEFFLTWNCDYFRCLYFSLAPLLAIPLYLQTEPESKLQAYPELALNSANDWECESIANFMGEKRFAHEASVTQNIVKVKDIRRGRKESTVLVTAYGFRTVEHTEHMTQLGGDGKLHDVPVRWLEYVQVQKQSSFIIAEQPNKADPRVNSDAHRADVIRRGLQAFFER